MLGCCAGPKKLPPCSQLFSGSWSVYGAASDAQVEAAVDTQLAACDFVTDQTVANGWCGPADRWAGAGTPQSPNYSGCVALGGPLQGFPIRGTTADFSLAGSYAQYLPWKQTIPDYFIRPSGAPDLVNTSLVALAYTMISGGNIGGNPFDDVIVKMKGRIQNLKIYTILKRHSVFQFDAANPVAAAPHGADQITIAALPQLTDGSLYQFFNPPPATLGPYLTDIPGFFTVYMDAWCVFQA